MDDHLFIQDLAQDTRLNSDNAQHIKRVLRKKPGDILHISDGKGTIWKTQLQSLDPVQVTILEHTYYPPLSPYLTIIISIIKPKNLELVIQKATEIGINRLIITETAYSQISLVDIQKKSARFQTIATEACKQAQRPHLLDIKIIPLPDIPRTSLNYLATTQAEQTPPLLTPEKEQDQSLFIGPEGGFAPHDYDHLSDFFPVRLTPYILRSETAAIVGSGLLRQLS